MSTPKQKLAQMVLQKIKQKKQAEQRNRPHYQLLQLNVQFSLQENQACKEQVQMLTRQLREEKNALEELRQNLTDLQNTGKRVYPVITIKPQFIASQHIPPSYKQFYRKTANTFLKADLIKHQKYQTYLQKQQQIHLLSQSIGQKQLQLHERENKNVKIMQDKRAKVLREDVRRRLMLEQQEGIQREMQRLRGQNQGLLKEYQIKKENLQSRMQYCDRLKVLVQQEKIKIEKKYNPITYREYLKDVFNVRIKNEFMEKNLIEVIKSLNQAKQASQRFKRKLSTKFAINFIGKTADSPSKTKGKMQKFLQKQSSKRSQTNPKNLTELIDFKSTVSQSISRPKKIKTSQHEQDLETSRSRQLMKNKGAKTERNYSSLKVLQTTFKSSLKSDRTLSTTLAMSSVKKRLSDF